MIAVGLLVAKKTTERAQTPLKKKEVVQVKTPLPPKPVPVVNPVFASSNTKKVIDYLSSNIGPRREGSIREHSAARYIYYKLFADGYKPKIQRFMLPNGKSSQNIIATKKGLNREVKLIIGAHYDSVRYSPGANDNATGVATLLELARILKDYPLKPSVDFVFFGSEEVIDEIADHHHYGSRKYASSLGKDGKHKVKAMISIDTIGVGNELFVRNLGIGSLAICSDLISVATKRGLDMTYKSDPALSDHESFERIGVPAAWIEYREDPNYHSSGDKAHNISYQNIQNVGDVVLGYMKTVK